MLSTSNNFNPTFKFMLMDAFHVVPESILVSFGRHAIVRAVPTVDLSLVAMAEQVSARYSPAGAGLDGCHICDFHCQ